MCNLHTVCYVGEEATGSNQVSVSPNRHLTYWAISLAIEKHILCIKEMQGSTKNGECFRQMYKELVITFTWMKLPECSVFLLA